MISEPRFFDWAFILWFAVCGGFDMPAGPGQLCPCSTRKKLQSHNDQEKCRERTKDRSHTYHDASISRAKYDGVKNADGFGAVISQNAIQFFSPVPFFGLVWRRAFRLATP